MRERRRERRVRGNVEEANNSAMRSSGGLMSVRHSEAARMTVAVLRSGGGRSDSLRRRSGAQARGERRKQVGHKRPKGKQVGEEAVEVERMGVVGSWVDVWWAG